MKDDCARSRSDGPTTAALLHLCRVHTFQWKDPSGCPGRAGYPKSFRSLAEVDAVLLTEASRRIWILRQRDLSARYSLISHIKLDFVRFLALEIAFAIIDHSPLIALLFFLLAWNDLGRRTRARTRAQVELCTRIVPRSRRVPRCCRSHKKSRQEFIVKRDSRSRAYFARTSLARENNTKKVYGREQSSVRHRLAERFLSGRCAKRASIFHPARRYSRCGRGRCETQFRSRRFRAILSRQLANWQNPRIVKGALLYSHNKIPNKIRSLTRLALSRPCARA